MTCDTDQTVSRPVADVQAKRTFLVLGCATLATASALVTGSARASSTPVGPLPAGPVSTVTTSPNQLVAVALPHAPAKSGLVWRLARRYDSRLVREVSET